MNLNQLDYIITVADEKNITRAARKLFISQPSLSLSIQSLEKELGTPLFERKNGDLSLTYAGKLFYDWAQNTRQSKQQLSLKISDIAHNVRHLIRIGISPHRCSILIPPVLERFYAVNPACDIELVEKPTFILKEMLEQGEIDFMLDIPHPDTNNYQSEILAEEHFLLALPKSVQLSTDTAHAKHDLQNLSVESPATKKEYPEASVLKRISLTALQDIPFITLTSEQNIGKIYRTLCATLAFQPNTVITCTNIETALSLVNRQLGATLIPEILAYQTPEFTQVQYYLVEQFDNTRPICLVYRKNQYQHDNLKTLLDIFREVVPILYRSNP